MTSLDGINGQSIRTLLRGENDSKQSDEFQATVNLKKVKVPSRYRAFRNSGDFFFRIVLNFNFEFKVSCWLIIINEVKCYDVWICLIRYVKLIYKAPICFGTWTKIYMLTKWLHSSSPRIITCANWIAENRLQRKTSPQFFVDKVIARSRRPEVSHGSYNGTDVNLLSCLLLLTKLIVLFITYSVSGSVDQNMTALF